MSAEKTQRSSDRERERDDQVEAPKKPSSKCIHLWACCALCRRRHPYDIDMQQPAAAQSSILREGIYKLCSIALLLFYLWVEMMMHLKLTNKIIIIILVENARTTLCNIKRRLRSPSNRQPVLSLAGCDVMLCWWWWSWIVIDGRLFSATTPPPPSLLMLLFCSSCLLWYLFLLLLLLLLIRRSQLA